MDSNVSKITNDDSGALMTVTARNLVYLMSKNGVDIAALSEATQLGTATIGSLRRGVGNPTLSTLSALSKFFNISLSELTEIDLSAQKKKINDFVKEIPLIKINDLNKFIERTLDHYETYTTEIEEARDRTYFAVLVNNDSLYPQFSTGTVFIVSEDDEPYDGDTVLVKIGSHAPCFRKILIDGDNFLFSPIAIENDVSPSIYLHYKLIGVVLKAIKTFSER
ncbi:MAG: helix-turn-helix transcriptional regulator [Ottowia sp.]|nr:helix-turn-helix transcriptional regulator [Ottowia sp.]